MEGALDMACISCELVNVELERHVNIDLVNKIVEVFREKRGGMGSQQC
jgi:hypothetical protein